MLNNQPISLLRVQQSHDSVLTVIVITGVPYSVAQTYSVALKQLPTQHFIACGRDYQGLEKYLNVSDL